MVSCDQDRNISKYRSFVSDNLQGLTIHFLEMTFVVQCNGSSLSVWDTEDF
jgi:hypothetical protein